MDARLHPSALAACHVGVALTIHLPRSYFQPSALARAGVTSHTLTLRQSLHIFCCRIAHLRSLETCTLNFAIAAATDRGSRASSDFQRFAFALAAFAALPPLLLAFFVIAVDP